MKPNVIQDVRNAEKKASKLHLLYKLEEYKEIKKYNE